MRLTQSMCTIAECAPGGDGPAGPATARPRLVKIAVVGGSGVGKTGEGAAAGARRVGGWRRRSAANGARLCLSAALVVRFLTRRFIGDYERNAGRRAAARLCSRRDGGRAGRTASGASPGGARAGGRGVQALRESVQTPALSRGTGGKGRGRSPGAAGALGRCCQRPESPGFRGSCLPESRFPPRSARSPRKGAHQAQPHAICDGSSSRDGLYCRSLTEFTLWWKCPFFEGVF